MWTALRCLRCTIFLLCLIFIVFGFLNIAAGLYVRFFEMQHTEDLYYALGKLNQFELFISSGCFLIIASFSGCWGALAEKKLLVFCFVFFCALCLILESAQLNRLISLERLPEESLAKVLSSRLRDCNESSITYWTNLELWGKCCGIYNGTRNFDSPCLPSCDERWTSEGCLHKLHSSIVQEANTLSYFVIITVPSEVVMIVFGCILWNLLILKHNLKKKSRMKTAATEEEEMGSLEYS